MVATYGSVGDVQVGDTLDDLAASRDEGRLLVTTLQNAVGDFVFRDVYEVSDADSIECAGIDLPLSEVAVVIGQPDCAEQLEAYNAAFADPTRCGSGVFGCSAQAGAGADLLVLLMPLLLLVGGAAPTSPLTADRTSSVVRSYRKSACTAPLRGLQSCGTCCTASRQLRPRTSQSWVYTPCGRLRRVELGRSRPYQFGTAVGGHRAAFAQNGHCGSRRCHPWHGIAGRGGQR